MKFNLLLASLVIVALSVLESVAFTQQPADSASIFDLYDRQSPQNMHNRGMRQKQTKIPEKLYLFTLAGTNTPQAYDETALVTCLQGIYNRENGPAIYLLPQKHEIAAYLPLPSSVTSTSPPLATPSTPKYWLDKFTSNSEIGWLRDREVVVIESIDELCMLVKPFVKKIVIWDENVPASFNVAFTIAGVEDGAVLSPAYADFLQSRLDIKVDAKDIIDLRGKFTGKVSGSKKNDAYLWAIDNYLAKGLCSKYLLCLYSDPFMQRETGIISYVVNRDWCVYNRAFVYDLSPWEDEVPFDDPNQAPGTDLKTYETMLAEQLKQTKGESMCEIAGFFNFIKYSNHGNSFGHNSSHEPVPTEWESVYVMSRFNCYQNTAVDMTFNQSLHSQYPFKPLKQSRPGAKPELKNACYIGIHMCDYDSAYPLYDFMPKFWDDPNRGKIALAWGINPNLIESYPDIIAYFYNTAVKDKDVFVADASAAGYFNPSRVQDQYWDMVVKHNRYFYDLTDMTMTPMVLDWRPLSDKVLDQMTKFSPDGLSSIIINFHADEPVFSLNHQPKIHNGVMIDEMLNNICDCCPVEEAVKRLTRDVLSKDTPDKPAFHYIRVVWMSPTYIVELIDGLKKVRPDLDIQLVNPYDYFRLHKQYLEQSKK